MWRDPWISHMVTVSSIGYPLDMSTKVFQINECVCVIWRYSNNCALERNCGMRWNSWVNRCMWQKLWSDCSRAGKDYWDSFKKVLGDLNLVYEVYNVAQSAKSPKNNTSLTRTSFIVHMWRPMGRDSFAKGSVTFGVAPSTGCWSVILGTINSSKL